MIQSIWNFVKRHKKKFIFTGVLCGGVVFIGKYAQRKLQEFQDKEATACLEHARKQHHFDSNQRTCNMTVLSMLPSLREALTEVLDTDQLTSQLKNRPSNKLELWEELKIKSFARVILSVYSTCMMIVLLRVQLNVIGGYMYLDSLKSQNGMTSSSVGSVSPDIQQRYLSLVQYLLSTGLNQMAEKVMAEVTFLMKDVSLKQKVNLENVHEFFTAIRQRIEVPAEECNTSVHHNLNAFMLPQDYTISDCDNPAVLNQLIEETRDMLESDDFHTVLATCLDTGFTRLLDKLAESFRSPVKTDRTLTFNPVDISMPLAKTVPIMNTLSHTVCSEAPNPFIQELLLKEQMKDFAANIYEAFSQSSDRTMP